MRALLLRSGWLQGELESQGIAVTVLPLAKPLDRRFLESLRDLLSELKPDVFHSHEITYGIYGRVATRRLGIPHVATVHGKNFAEGVKRRAIGCILFRGGRRFRLVAVSRSLSAAISRGMALNRTTIGVIPNGVEVGSSAAEPAARADGALRIIAVGNLYAVKNHALLVRAVEALVGKGLDIRLEILGRGREEGALRASVSRNRLERHVALRGFREDVSSFLSGSHVFVSSSLSEGMPLSFLEAMAAGLPVVASRVGGVPEIVEHEKQGLLYESRDLDGLVAAIERLARDEDLRRRLGDGAAARVRSDFSVERMVDRYEGLYGEVASNRER